MTRDESALGLKLLDEHPLEDTSDEEAHDRGLLMIGLFKLSKALFFFSLGLGAVHFLHKDLGDAALRLAESLRMDPESHIVTEVLDKLDLIDAHRLRQISFATFGYSGLALTEGVGLMLEKVWAEYLTVFLTMCLLPWEVYEMVMRADWFRSSMLAINLLVLGYLLYALRKKRMRRQAAYKAETREDEQRLSLEISEVGSGSSEALADPHRS